MIMIIYLYSDSFKFMFDNVIEYNKELIFARFLN